MARGVQILVETLDKTDKNRILFIERKFQGLFSLEKVFRQLAKNLSADRFETAFQTAPFGSGITAIIRNLISFSPEKADVYHITGDITYLGLVLPPEKTVLTIHDLSILRYRSGIRRFVLRKLLFDWPAKRMKFITVISSATKDDLVRHTGCDPRKIWLIENPVDEILDGTGKTAFNTDRPNILQVGTLPYKNLPNVISAIEGLDCTFTVIGDLDDKTEQLLIDRNIDYRNEIQLNNEAMKEQYRKADLVVFCSVYEGFGLPIIEAQAMRTPVITSDRPPMSDVAGNGAVLVDPYDVDAIRVAIRSVINDAELRSRLVEHGVENVKRFRSDVIAEKYERLYDRVLDGSK